MAGTISYLYDPNQDVFVINDVRNYSGIIAVQEGRIIRVNIDVLSNDTSLTYDVVVAGENGTKNFVETDIFPDLPTAIAEYQLRLQS
jgi:hypothetical protein